jgi:acetyl esterase/lipase
MLDRDDAPHDQPVADIVHCGHGDCKALRIDSLDGWPTTPIDCPIFIVQGGRNQYNQNTFNEQVLVPELRAAKKIVEVRTYAEQGHCFCAASGRPQADVPPSGPRAARAAFRDIDQFCRRYLRTQPKAIDARLIQWTPVRVDFSG